MIKIFCGLTSKSTEITTIIDPKFLPFPQNTESQNKSIKMNIGKLIYMFFFSVATQLKYSCAITACSDTFN